MNNNQQCPICRSPLTTLTCKKCGYQEKRLKIVETQQQFGKFNYFNKIQGVRTSNKKQHNISSQEKLKLYLKQYVKLLKTATNKLSTTNSLSHQQHQHLHLQVLHIWKTYIIKRKQMNFSLTGMFKRYIANNKQKIKMNKNDSPLDQSNPPNLSEKQSDSSQQEVAQTKKRRAASKIKQNHKQGSSLLSVITKFRSYFLITVKPLIQQSIEQRKIDKEQLTSCQKSFLSYLLAIEQQITNEFITICSLKYLKLLLQLNGRSSQKSFIKQTQISEELKIRNIRSTKKKDQSILIILMIDLLYCLNDQGSHIKHSLNLKQLLEDYQKRQTSYKIIDGIVLFFNKNTAKQSPNIPQINYQLIYTIINLASLKVGLCLTIPQIVVGCEKLQINKIIIDEDTSIEGIPNEEAINSTKIRKNTHLLSSFLSCSPLFYIQKWTNKLCCKFGLQNQAPKISTINQLLFTELQLTQSKNESRGFFYTEQGKMIKYHRHIWIEQDIACLTAIVIFLKLSAGITQYPYLINFPLKQAISTTNILGTQFHVIQSLLKNGQIKTENRLISFVKRIFLPQIYKKQINLIHLSQHLTALSAKDKYFSIQSFNKSSIRYRNLSHLNGASSNDILQSLSSAKKYQFEDKQYQIQMKHDEHQHKQFTRQIGDRFKKLKMKRNNSQVLKQKKHLNSNLIRQISCIMGNHQKIVTEGNTNANEQCPLDQPSTNYQIMYQYSQENLIFSNRIEQLHFMELLCFNICSFSQLMNWLCRYENILKHFEL